MSVFTHMRVPTDDDTCVFGRQLMGICRVLSLVPPIFKGRVVPSDVPTVHRWEIETEVLSRPIGTPTAPIVFKKKYTSWGTGLLMAKQEVLSRICEQYFELLPPESIYRRFGKRDRKSVV